MIGIDGNEANQKVKVGSGVYAFELLRHFEKYQISNIKYQIYLKDKPIAELPSETINWQYKLIKPSKLWTQFGLPIHLWKEKLVGNAPNVFFSPSHYAPRFCPVPSVVTIFDLSFIRFPEMFLKKDLYQLRNWTNYSIKQAKKIITISEFSKKEIVDYYKINPQKISVAYPGYDSNKYKISNIKNKKHISNIKNKYKINTDYILFVGTIQPRKNLVRLLEAFTIFINQVRKAKPNQVRIKLVICGMIDEGRGGWMQENLKSQISNLKLENEVVVTGYVEDEDLPYLISGTKALVLPSLYEGFGIPVIEAMACGVPTVVSNVSSLPEIVGEAAILVDPYDVEDIARGISEACYNNSKREALIKRGLQRIKKYNWAESAKMVLNLLKSFI